MFTTIKSSFNLLPKRGKFFVFLSSLIQVFISLLDVLGIGFIAGAAILAVKLFGTPADSTSDNFVYRLLNSLTHDDRKSIYLLLGFAFVFFVSKSILSALLFRKQLNFLVRRDFTVSRSAINVFLNRNLDKSHDSTSQEKIVAMSNGMWLSTSEILGNFIAVISEIGLLILIIILLMFADFKLALLSFLYFLFIFMGMFYLVGRSLQSESTRSSISGLNQQNLLKIMLLAQRDIKVFRRESFFAEKFLKSRADFAAAASNVLFLMFLPKMFIEVALVLGVFLLSVYQFLGSDAVSAVSTLTLYLAAGTRILPSLLRLQNAISSIRAGVPGAEMFHNLLNQSSSPLGVVPLELDPSLKSQPGTEVLLENVCFNYEPTSKFSIERLSLRIKPGSLCALVGDSGSGKSTLVDLILGLIEPNSGKISYKSGNVLKGQMNSVGIGYVPQNIAILPGSIRENINFGANFEDSEIWKVLSMSGLEEFVSNLPEKLDSILEEDGRNLSGGQIQRIAISRALISKPSLLILDEATSSLDTASHENISSTLSSLKGGITVISISHNWSSLDLFDQIIHLSAGSVVYNGDYSGFINQLD